MARYGSAGTVKGDPHWITARRADSCRTCSEPIKVGARVFYWPKGGRYKCQCEACGDAAEQRFIAEVADEWASGGWS